MVSPPINFLTAGGYPYGRENMKRALVLIALILLTLPSVSAGGLTYHPGPGPFQAFLQSNSTYHVVAGNTSWARGWAYYVDTRLGTLKSHGNDTLVLVGNLRNNALMRKLWKETGLPGKASFEPGVIIVNRTIFITGSEDNIYLTERAFSNVWAPPKTSTTAFYIVFLLVAVLLGLPLRKSKTHAGSFYMMAASLVFLWAIASPKQAISTQFLKAFSNALTFHAGGSATSPPSILLGLILRVVPPLEENLTYAHWIAVLLLAGLSFYIAPRTHREIGFITFGLAFAAPLFRGWVAPLNTNIMGLVLFTIVLAMVCNLTFSAEGHGTFLKAVVLAAITVAGGAMNPYILLVPLAFLLTFPGRPLRNYTYVGLSLLGGVALYLTWPSYMTSFLPSGNGAWEELGRVIFQTFPAVLVMAYSANRRGGSIKKRGYTPFLLLLTLLYLATVPFVNENVPYAILSISALASRTIHNMANQT